jgi:hypothetical protein
VLLRASSTADTADATLLYAKACFLALGLIACACAYWVATYIYSRLCRSCQPPHRARAHTFEEETLEKKEEEDDNRARLPRMRRYLALRRYARHLALTSHATQRIEPLAGVLRGLLHINPTANS